MTQAGWAAIALLVGLIGWRSATHSVDFPIYHHAGAQVLAGDFELYPPEVYDGRPVGGHGFRYAPVWALLFVPFALLPLPVAAGLFFLLKVIAIGALCIMLVRDSVRAISAGRLIGVMLLVTGGYLVEELRGGNLQLFVIIGIVFAVRAAARGRVVGPAVILGLATTAKLTPLAFVLYLTLRHGLRHFAAAAAVIAVLLAAPILVWGLDQNARLFAGFTNYSLTALETPDNARNYSVRGLLGRVVPTSLKPSLETIWIAVVAVTGVAVMALMRRRWTERRGALELALLLTLMPLLSPHSQRIYFAALSAAVMLTVMALPGGSASRRLARLAFTVVGMTSTLLPLVLSSRALSLRYMDFFPYTVSAAVLAGALGFILASTRDDS